jgi:hypothetical protein
MSKKLILVLVLATLLSFAQNVLADEVLPSVISYTLNGLEQNATFNPSDTVGVEITINTNEPVKFTRIKVKNSDGAEVKFFTSTSSFVSTVTKTWDGKNAAGEIVPDGVYTLEVNIKDAADNSRSNLVLTPYTITLDISAMFSDEENNEEESETLSNGGGSSSSSSSSTTVVTSAKIKAEIIVSYIAYAGIPLAFQGKITRGGQQLYNGKYFWNFGDGDFREVKTINIDKFSHTYFYPGEYSVLFEYYPNTFAEVPDAFDKITIKVLEPSVIISAVGDASDFFVELTNQTSYVADISEWILASTDKTFTLPRHTTLASKQKMMLSPQLTNFSISDKSTLRLLTPQGELVFAYTGLPTPKVPLGKTAVRQPTPISSGSPSLPLINSFDSISENLPAAVSDSGIFESETQNSSSTSLVFILFLALVGVSALAVYFIRRKGVVFGSDLSTPTGQDFEILDE